jgi:hypothetical protein
MPLSASTKHDILRQECANTDIVLLTISHSSWSKAIRLSTHATQHLGDDKETHVPLYGTKSRGKKFWYVPIQATIPNSTDEQAPEGKFIISNITREVAPYLKMVDREYPKITIEVVNSATPDVVDMSFPSLDLQTATWNADTVEVTVKSDIAATEPSPWLRFSVAYFPNMQA